ncbi:MAG: hypothetical protein GXP14_04970 [Gammaproteobacteria bacterium]|nr:hypothetical protein [Gammaproteobacteria bacterium]
MKNPIALNPQHRGITFLFLLLLFILISFDSKQAQAAINFVQTVGQGASASSTSFNTTSVLSVSSNVSAGNSLIITMVLDQGSGLGVTCSDSQGNSYTIDLDRNDTVMRSVTCSAHNVTALTTADTFTITHPWIWGRVISVHEFSGLSASTTLDGSSAAGGSVVSTNSGSTNTNLADELLFGSISVEGPIADGFTSGTGYTPLLPRTGNASAPSGYPLRTLNTQYQIVSSTGTYSSTATLATPRWWISSITTYRAAVATITLSGTCQQVDQVTNCSDTGTVRVAINGTLQAQTQPIVSGSWTISGITAPASGDVITVFIDGALNAREAVAVSKYDGTGNITGVELIENHLTIGSDDNQTLTNADLSQYDNSVSGDGDIFHEVNTLNDLTVDITGSLTVERLYIKSGNTYQPSGNVSTRDLEINGTLIADSNNINLSGSWDNNAIFTAGTSSVNFTAGSGTETVDSSGATTADFYNINFNNTGGTAIYQLESILNVSNDLTISDGILDTKNGSNYAINVANDFLQSGGQIQARSSTLTVGRHFMADGSDSNTGYNNASLVMNGVGSLTYNNLSSPWNNGFNNLTAGQGGNTTTQANIEFSVLNVLTVGSGTLTGSGNAPDIYLRGAPNPLSFDINSIVDIDTLYFHGNVTQNIPPLSNGYDSHISLSRNNSNVTQSGPITLNTGNNLILDGDSFSNRAVTYNTGGFDLNVGGYIRLGTGADTGSKIFNITNSNVTIGTHLDIRSGTTTLISTNSSVFLNGTAAQTVLSSGESFNNLIVTNASTAGVRFLDALTTTNFTNTTAGSTLTFDTGSPHTVLGTLNLNGTNSSEIILQSDVAGTRFTLDVTSGMQTVSYVNVTDAEASSNNIIANNSTSVSNNDDVDPSPHWIFSTPISLSGTCKQQNETSNCADGRTIAVAINGTLQGQTTTTSAGSWSISNVAPLSGDIITVFIDGAMDINEAVAVTKYDGTGNMTGIELIEEHLTIGSDDNQTLSNADLSQYDNSVSGDEDVFYDVNAANNLTVDITGALLEETLYIKENNTYRPDSGNAGEVTTRHVKILGTITADDNTLTVNGDWDNTNGTFNAGTSTVDFAGSGTISVDITNWWASEKRFYNVNAAASGNTTTILATRGMVATNIMTLGTGTVAGGVVILGKNGGTPLVTSGATLSNSQFKYNPWSNPVNITSTSYPNLWLASGSVDNNFILLGDISCNTLLLMGNGAGRTSILDTANQSLTCNQLQIGSTSNNQYGKLLLNNSVATINGDVNIYASDSGGTNEIDAGSGNINVRGNWINNDMFTAAISTVTFDGNVNQSITSSGYSFNNLVISNTGSALQNNVFLNETLNINGDLTITTGTLDTTSANNYALSVSGNYEQSSTTSQMKANGSTITVGGDFTADGTMDSTSFSNASLILTGTGSLVYTNTAAWLITNGFKNLTAGQNGNTTTVNSNIAIANLLTIGSGTFGVNKRKIYLFALDSLAFDINSNVTNVDLRFFGIGNQNIPTLTNGYEANIEIANNGLTVNQTGNITINNGKYLYIGDNPNRDMTYNTAGFDLSISGNLIVGAGNDTALKRLDGSNSTITISTNLNIQAQGSGTIQANFISTDSTLILDGSTAQSITMSGNAFNDLTLSNASSAGITFNDGFTVNTFSNLTPNSTLNFKGGATYTINGILDFNGQTTASKIKLRSTDTSQYIFDVTAGIQNVDYVDVEYAAASSNNIYAHNATDGVGNDDGTGDPQWWFTSSIDISGFAFADDNEIMPLINQPIRLVIDGNNEQNLTATTDANGAYAITAGLSPGQTLLSYLDTNGATVGNTVTVGDGNPLSGFNIYQNHLVIRNDNGGTTSNADLSTAQYSDGNDMLFSVDGSDNLLADGAATELFIPSVHTYTPGGGVVTTHVDINGSLIGEANTISVSGNWDSNGGTFTSTGEVIFQGAGGIIRNAGQTFNHVDIGSGLVGHWNFDETSGTSAADGSGFGNIGTHINSPAISNNIPSVNFINDRSLSFDGIDDYIDAGTHFSLKPVDQVTVSLWAYIDSSSQWESIVANAWDNGSSESGYDLFFSNNTNGIAFRVATSSNNLFATTSVTTLQLGQWYHLAGTYDGSSIKLYVNGTLNSSVLKSGNINYSPLPSGLYIGKFQDSNESNEFDGNIDDVRIYNRALSAAEVSALASGTRAGNAYGTYTLQDPMDIDGNLDINTGTLDTHSVGNYTLNVAGNWTNKATFTANSGTVTLDGSNQTLRGDNTFYNLDKTVSSSDILTFGAGETQTINNNITLSGAPLDLLSLRSTASPLQWKLNIGSGASKAIDYVDVQDSDASGSDNSQKTISPTNSIDSDNNIDWFAYPKAYYQLDETVWGSVIDSSGFNQHGNIIGSVSPSDTNPAVTGNPGSCGYADIDANTTLLSFDAIDTGVNIESDIGNTGTINFWYKSNSNWQGGADRQLLDASTAAGKVFYLTLKSTGQLFFGIIDSVNTNLDLAGNIQNFTANTWVHIAISWDLPNNQLQIFINGSLDKTDSSYSSNGIISNLNSLYIGDNRSSYQNGNMTPNSANGAIDELRIYDEILSTSKIQSDKAATHPCNPALPAPIAEWRLNELSWDGTVNEVVDSGVNALLHGVRQGGATPTTAKSCNGATLNGSSDFLEVADNNLLDINDKLTVMGWFKADSLPGSGQLKGIIVKNLNYELYLDENGNIYWWWNNASDTSRSLTSSGVTITPGNWYHVALVYDNSGSQKIYIDGIERNSDTLAENLKTTASTLKIGATTGSTGRYFDGQIDEVRIYNAALSASQINVAMNQTYTCTADIIAYYNLDEANWGVVADNSGNNNDGSVISGVIPRNNTPVIAGNIGTCGYADIPANTSATIFDAIDTTVDINDDVGNTGTISFWYKSNTQWNDASGADRQLLDASRTNKYFYLSLDKFGILHLGLEDSSDFDIRLAGNSQNFAANTWVHLTITWDLSNDVLQIYINGSLDVSQQYITSGTLGQLDTLYLGDNRSNYFTTYMTENSANGALDEVRIYNSVLSANDIINDRDNTHPCPQYLDHFVVTHDGQGIHCAGEDVSVSAKFIDGSTYTSYIGSITLDTQSGNGTWTLTSGSGSFNDALPDDGIATYTYDISDNGVATFSLSYLSGTASIDIDSYDGFIRDDDSESNLVFSASGFTVTATALNNPPNLPIDLSIANQIAATNLNLYLAAYGATANDSTCGIIEGYTGVKNLNFWSNYSNPTSGTVTVTIEGSNIATNESASTAQNVTFTQGQAEITVNYTDVGAISIEMKDATNSDPNLPGGIKGASSTFVVKPAGFILSDIVRTSDSLANPAASGASGEKFMAAGEPFSVAVSAVNSDGDTTPNYGQETSPEAITLTPALIAPSGGATGTFSEYASGTGFDGFVSGVDTGSYKWTEVGIISLTPSVADGDYLGTGDIIGTTSNNIGRFYPSYFITTKTDGSFANICISSTPLSTPFTYLGQSFSYMSQPTITTTAKNSTGTTTVNYSNAFAKLTTGGVSLNYPSADNTQVDENGSTALTLSSLEGSLTRLDHGDGSLTFTLGAGSPDSFVYDRSAGQVAPFMADLSIQLTAVTDGEASANDLASPKDIKPAGNLQRFGRGYAQDAYGTLAQIGDSLTLNMGAQYFAGNGDWLDNTDDSCSTFSYSTPTSTEITVSASPSSAVPISNGIGNLTLSITGDSGNIGGSSQVTTNWETWLRFDLDGGGLYNDSPSATATFGIFRGDDRYLDWRETP